MALSKERIMGMITGYHEKWSRTPHSFLRQTDMFLKWVPDDESDFTVAYRSIGFNQIFTGDRLRTGAGFNCHHLYRQMRKKPDILVYSDDKTSIFQPLGEPGRDVDENKDAHLMAVSHSFGDSDPRTFNECLPTTEAEDRDLGRRVALIKSAVLALRRNAPVSECGPKVVERATELGVVLDMGIQQFFLHQILSLSPEILAGPPGYVLKKDGVDIGKNKEELEKTIGKVFENEGLVPMMFIQPPDRNTQLLSHIHCFMLDPSEPLPTALEDNYLSVELIQAIKYELKNAAEEWGEDAWRGLVRTATPPILVEHPYTGGSSGEEEADEESVEDVGLSRQGSVAPRVAQVDNGFPLCRQNSVA
jgi:hypothetical protein